MMLTLPILSIGAVTPPQDDFFPIVPWDGLWGWDAIKGFGDPLQSVADCNFTVAGFVQPSQLRECKKLGLKAIIAPPPKAKEPWAGKWYGQSDAEIESAIAERVQKAGASDTILGYFIVDEPSATAFPTLGKVVAAVRKHAPGKMAYINLYPGYATIGAPDKSQLGARSFAEYLERFATEVKPDILSYDNYKVTLSDDLQNKAEASSFFSDLMEVRRVSQKYGIPFWNICCANRIRPSETIPSPANLLLQAYATLAAGGRGLEWYTYYDHGYAYAPIDKSGARNQTWFYLQMVNRQVKTLGPIMNRLKSTAVLFTDPPAAGLSPLPGRVIKSVDSTSSIKGFGKDAPAIMVGEFEGADGHDYAMLVNLSLEKSTNVKLHTAQVYAHEEVISAVDAGSAPFDETNGQWLVPGSGLLIRLTR